MNHFFLLLLTVQTGVVKTGGFRYDDGTRYIGDWNQKGQKHGMGHLLLPDGTRYGTQFSFLVFFFFSSTFSLHFPFLFSFLFLSF